MSEYVIFVLALVGFVLSLYIFLKKQRKEKIFCLIGKDCDKVIHSQYSTHLVENEILGMIYYFLLVLTSIIFILSPALLITPIITTRIITVGFAALFSIYLSIIQISKLKELCEYCLGANLINIILFVILVV